MKVLVSKAFYKIYSWASDGNYDPALCNFSISKRIVVDNYCKMRELHRAFVIYVKWMGFRIGTLDVHHEERYEGKSSYNFKKRMKMATSILTSQSDKLIKLTVGLGFVVSVFSTGHYWFDYSLFYYKCRYIRLVQHYCNNLPDEWTLMMCIGIVGTYVGNIFMQVKERPLYIVRTVLNETENK